MRGWGNLEGRGIHLAKVVVKVVANTELVPLMYDGKREKDKDFKASTKFTVQHSPKIEKIATLAS